MLTLCIKWMLNICVTKGLKYYECPRCGSRDLFVTKENMFTSTAISPFHPFGISKGITKEVWRCKQCGTDAVVKTRNVSGADDAAYREAVRNGKVTPLSKSDSSTLGQSESKICPFCAEEIKVAAVKCKHCGEFLDKADN